MEGDSLLIVNNGGSKEIPLSSLGKERGKKREE